MTTKEQPKNLPEKLGKKAKKQRQKKDLSSALRQNLLRRKMSAGDVLDKS